MWHEARGSREGQRYKSTLASSQADKDTWRQALEGVRDPGAAVSALVATGAVVCR